MDYKYAVVNSSKQKKLVDYKGILQKHNLEIKIVEDLVDKDDTCEVFYITISSLEELLQLKQEVGTSIILCDSHYDALTNYYEEPTIEIYDSYRE